MLVRDSISAIIIDDENHSIQTLKYELSRHCPQVLVVHTSTTIREGKLAIEQHRPDLLFLDIEMPGGNGFQLLNDMETIDFEVIFVTAYDQYAIQAFRFAAIDYLLKPIIAKNLIDAVDRVSIKKKGTLTKRQLVNLLHNLKSDMHHSPRIAIPNGSTTEFIDVEQILHCEANSNYTYVFTKNEGRFLMSKTLRELEEWLTPFEFFRCHYSHLINLVEIKRYVKEGGFYVILSDQSRVPVSRRRIEQFQEIIRNIN